ncbi:lamin tail domain-containing protein [Patescibacteria group bacterium]|nr:lamin tail domain-containing protein [Patescibacteria group bacterium]
MIKKIKFIFLPIALIFIGIAYTGALFSSSVLISNNNISTGVWNPGRATISEVLYDPSGTDTGKEFIEIYNSGGYALDMTGYVLHIDGGGTNDYIFPSFTLNSGSIVLVHVNSTGTNTATDLYWNNGLNMGDSSGSVVLFKQLPKDSTTIIDFVQWGAANQDGEAKAILAVPPIWVDNAFVPDVVETHSIELIGKIDNNLINDWQDQSVPTPGV